MSLAPSISQDQIFAVVGAFLTTVLPAGVVVIQDPSNRAAMPPPSPGFVGMTLIMARQVSTNLTRFDPDNGPPATLDIEQPTELTLQLDCYGAQSGDWAEVLLTAFRSSYGCEQLAPLVSPLYAQGPRFAELTDDELEYENRWIVEARLQYNPVISPPQQYADTATVGIINVDEAYPP